METDCHNLLQLLEMPYFAFKIVSSGEQAYKSKFGQTGYSTVLEQV